MKISSDNSVLVFGQELNTEEVKAAARGTSSEDLVLTEEVLKAAYPMFLTVKANINGQELSASQKLYYHFCEDLHTNKTAEEYEDWKEKDNTDQDERLIFVTE